MVSPGWAARVALLGSLGVASSSCPAMGADEAAWQARIDASRDAEDEGRVPEAERELREALREAERPGAARMLVARSLEELADFYHRQGRPAEAEPLYLRSIAAWEEVLGPRQPRVGIPVHNLAVLYLAECRVEEALPLIARVADLWEAALGPSHPDRVTALRTEATLLRRCGRGDEASRLDSRMPAGS